MKCENCNNEHNGLYGSGRFCSIRCARGMATKQKREEINKKVSVAMTGRKLSDSHKKQIEAGNNFNRKEKIIKYCVECNKEMMCRPSEHRKKYCSTRCWVLHTEKNKEPFLLYRQRCNFNFDVNHYPNKFDLTMISEYGWYSPSNKGNNLNGISKDHMLSVKEGYEQGIDANIINHPANCKLMVHRENQKKNQKSSITIEELLERIKTW